jgi:hypothetical protein
VRSVIKKTFISSKTAIMKNAFKHSGKIMFSIALVFSSFVIMSGSCNKDDNPPANTDVYTLSANASGANENPATGATATGTLSGTYNKSTNKLTYTIAWNGLTGTPAALHFHGPALAGVNASPVITLNITNATATGGASGEATLTEAQEADLLGGKWYWNVHTAAFVGGEIRGQVSATL